MLVRGTPSNGDSLHRGPIVCSRSATLCADFGLGGHYMLTGATYGVERSSCAGVLAHGGNIAVRHVGPEVRLFGSMVT